MEEAGSFETAMTVRITVFLDAMPFSLVDQYQRFEGILCLHLYVRGARIEASGSSETAVTMRITACPLV
jgi:hypothetical protein